MLDHCVGQELICDLDSDYGFLTGNRTNIYKKRNEPSKGSPLQAHIWTNSPDLSIIGSFTIRLNGMVWYSVFL